MSNRKQKRKSSRKLMENRSKVKYHFQVMDHYANLSKIQKTQGGAPKQTVNKSTGRGN